LIIVFGVKLKWFPFIYRSNIDQTGLAGVMEHIRQAALPIAVLTLFQTAGLMRYTRASMLEAIRQDYVRTARAKGLRENKVLTGHAMRNALIPVVTIIALQIPGIFGGAVVTEQIFRVPGMGSLLISAITNKDTPVIMAVTFLFAVLVVLCNLLADVVYGLLDPRIKYS
jgi:peptide/nickel transport system permease protein